MANWLGYRWLSDRYGVTPVQPFRIDSQLAKSRTTERSNGFIHEFYPQQFKPEVTFAGHMTFALKREGVHLEFLARLFDVLPPADLDAWLAEEPTGQYSRRTGFLYEWLTEKRLGFAGVGVGNYIDALDSNLYLTATTPENVPRWRVRNNLPGTRDYCPMVYRTDAVQAAETYDCNKRLHDLELEYGEDLIMRSAVWLTVKESQASFAIEREGNHVDKIRVPWSLLPSTSCSEKSWGRMSSGKVYMGCVNRRYLSGKRIVAFSLLCTTLLRTGMTLHRCLAACRHSLIAPPADRRSRAPRCCRSASSIYILCQTAMAESLVF